MRTGFYTTIAIVVAAFGLFAVGCSQPVGEPEISEEVKQQVAEEEAREEAERVARESTEPEFETKAAGVGATGKGEYGVTSEEPMSIITVPISTYFRAQEMMVFNVQIPHAMQLFQGSEGRFPNSEEEFFQKIIKEGQIQLPKLPEGDSYFYDVEQHTLMIQTRK